MSRLFGAKARAEPKVASVYEPGTVVRGTPYSVTRLLGRGGMGAVYEVEHGLLGRRFVLKLLHAGLAAKGDVVARMQNEWRTLGRLQHPNIVQVTDAGATSDGLPYYVMERLEGEVLDAVLARRRRLDPLEAVQITLDVLAGLAAAHAEHAIHRDIKPQNVFVTTHGAKILDFGIAKLRDQALRVVTKAGVALGTPRYMAPEQAEGKAVDARTDLYATGLVLFEMLVGRGPFSHLKDAGELVLAQIGQDPPRVDVLVPSIPEELGDFTQRLLAKLPDSRPRSAALAERELRVLLGALQSAEVPTEVTAVGPDPNDCTLGASMTPAEAETAAESRLDGPVPSRPAVAAERATSRESLAPTESLGSSGRERHAIPAAGALPPAPPARHARRARAPKLLLLAALSLAVGGASVWMLIPTSGAARAVEVDSVVPRLTEGRSPGAARPPSEIARDAPADTASRSAPVEPRPVALRPVEPEHPPRIAESALIPVPLEQHEGATSGESALRSGPAGPSGGPAIFQPAAARPLAASSAAPPTGARSSEATNPKNSAASTARERESGLPPSGLW